MGGHIRGRRTILACALAAAIGGLLALVSLSPAGAVTGTKALILASSVENGMSSAEAQRALALGYTVDLVDDATWGSMTAAQFAEYRLIVVGDPDGGIPAAASANAQALADAVMGRSGGNTHAGNRVLIGTDPVGHAPPAERLKIVETGIEFAQARPDASGLYLTLSDFDQDWDDNGVPDAEDKLLPLLTIDPDGGWTQNQSPPCGAAASLISNADQFATLRSSDLQGWNCSVHMSFPQFPDDWTPLAVATDTAGKPTCGTDVDTGEPACGEAYILIAGSGVVAQAPNLTLTPTTATNPVGSSHTITAAVTTDDGVPVPGTEVSFVVTGANASAQGTCAPADCRTDTSGQVTFTYTGANSGDDTINASFTVDGSRQTATAAKTWTQASFTLTLTPETALNDLRTSHTVVAELRDGQGPVAGATIVFEVTGAHTETGTATTGPDGKAEFTYTGANRGTDSIRACVDGSENGACDSSEVTASAEKEWAELSGSADVGVTISASPETVDPGQQVSFAVVATNSGPFRAPGANVTVVLPGNVSFVSASTSKGSCNGGSTTTCSLDTLEVGESASIGVAGTASSPGAGTAQAHVSSSAPDPSVGSNNSASAGVTVTGAVEDDGEPLPPPEPGEGNGAPLRGTVLVNGQPVDGPVRLESGDVVNTTDGTLELETVNGTGQFAGGTFRYVDLSDTGLLRRATAGAEELGVTEIRLLGGNFKRACATTTRRLSTHRPPRKKTRVRSLWGNAKGSFRTRGRHSSATVRGTVWYTADRCDGTLTFVREGSVLVEDFRLKRTRIVQAGKRYLAQPRANAHPARKGGGKGKRAR